MSFKDFSQTYTAQLASAISNASVTIDGAEVDASSAFSNLADTFRTAHASGGKIIFVGNGGSAAIASHQAYDYWKNGKMRAMSFNDSSLLTGSANDFGYPDVFAKPIEMFATKNDVVIAISSSGQSANIVNAAKKAKEIGCFVVTMSAFKSDNPLRSCGNVNVYLNTTMYGHAELGHETILHTILDYTLFGNAEPEQASLSIPSASQMAAGA